MIPKRLKTTAIVAMTIAAALAPVALVEGCDQGTNAVPGYNAGEGGSANGDLCPKVDPNFDSIASQLLDSNTCGATRGGLCHSSKGAVNSGGLDYTVDPAAMYGELLGDGGSLKRAENISGDDRTLYRVVPGDAGASFLYIKLVTQNTADPHYGSGMPLDHPGQLCPAAIAAVKTWIDEGAPFESADAGLDAGEDSGITDAAGDTGSDASDQ